MDLLQFTSDVGFPRKVRIMTKCNGCGTELVDGGVDWYCPNKECSYERDAAKAWLAEYKEQKEWEQYLRLKEKFEGQKGK